jgi:hypothetical protein
MYRGFLGEFIDNSSLHSQRSISRLSAGYVILGPPCQGGRQGIRPCTSWKRQSRAYIWIHRWVHQ